MAPARKKPVTKAYRKPARSLAVRIAAAQAAVTASKKTASPVDPRVKKLAGSR